MSFVLGNYMDYVISFFAVIALFKDSTKTVKQLRPELEMIQFQVFFRCFVCDAFIHRHRIRDCLVVNVS